MGGATALTTRSARCRCRRRFARWRANSPSNLPSTDQCAVRKSCAPADTSAEFSRYRRTVHREGGAGQRLEYRAKRRIAGLSHGPRRAGREARAACRSVTVRSSARAPSSVRVSFGVCALERQTEAAAGRIGLAVGRRVEPLGLDRRIRRDARHRQHRNAIPGFAAQGIALAGEGGASTDRRTLRSGWW